MSVDPDHLRVYLYRDRLVTIVPDKVLNLLWNRGLPRRQTGTNRVQFEPRQHVRVLLVQDGFLERLIVVTVEGRGPQFQLGFRFGETVRKLF